MTYALVTDESIIPVYGSFADANGTQHPASVLQLWSEEELLAVGVHKIIVDPPPEDVIVTGSHLEIIDGKVHRVYETTPYDLDVERQNKKAQIDSAAEAERNKYLTPGAGQSMAYQAKVDEAFEWINSGGTGYYPMLEAELGITADNMDDLTQLIILMHSRWQQVSAGIERARLLAKKQVDEAQTYDDIMAVTPEWPQVEV